MDLKDMKGKYEITEILPLVIKRDGITYWITGGTAHYEGDTIVRIDNCKSVHFKSGGDECK